MDSLQKMFRCALPVFSITIYSLYPFNIYSKEANKINNPYHKICCSHDLSKNACKIS